MRKLDERIQKKFKDEHGIELSIQTLSVLRKAIEVKIIKVLKNKQSLHIPNIAIFPQYSKHKKRTPNVIQSIDESSPPR